jgi:SGNH hydrolase-like domain, acetyltransferase AlgX
VSSRRAARIGYVVGYVLGIAIVFNAGARVVLWYLAAYRHVTYQPRPLELEPRDREAIAQVIADDPHTAIAYDPELGWLNRVNHSANAQGVRAQRLYAPAPAPGVLRVAAFGDSFTYANGIEDDRAWSARMEQRDPRVEVLNYGVGAYGLDQALLRFRREGAMLGSRVVLIGLLSENITRHVNALRAFLYPGGTPWAKPRFVLGAHGLELVPNPLPARADYARLRDHEAQALRELGAHDYYYQTRVYAGPLDALAAVRLYKLARTVFAERRAHGPIFVDGIYNPESEAYRVTEAIVDTFHDEVRARGATPLVLLFPWQTDLQRAMDGKPASYQPLAAHLSARGVDYVDVLAAFVARRPAHAEQFFLRDGHYNDEGNRVVAETVLAALAARGLLK